MADERIEKLRTVYAEWAKGNLGAGAELFSDELTYEPMSDGREILSRDQVDDYVLGFLQQWNDFSIEAVDYEELGDTVLVTEVQRGTGTSSGVPTEMTFYTNWTFDDEGKVKRVRWETDREAALKEIGP